MGLDSSSCWQSNFSSSLAPANRNLPWQQYRLHPLFLSNHAVRIPPRNRKRQMLSSFDTRNRTSSGKIRTASFSESRHVGIITRFGSRGVITRFKKKRFLSCLKQGWCLAFQNNGGTRSLLSIHIWGKTATLLKRRPTKHFEFDFQESANFK